MSSVECTWQEFKNMAKEFREAVPTLDIDQLDNAWKCLGLAYLGLSEPMWQSSAAMLLNMEAKTYMRREHELTSDF